MSKLKRVSKGIDEIHNWLTQSEAAYFNPEYPELRDDPDQDAIRKVLKYIANGDPARRLGRWGISDAAVFYAAGHGVVVDGEHWLVLKETDPQNPSNLGIRSIDILRSLKTAGIDQALIIIDSCHAGRIFRQFDSVPDSWIVMVGAGEEKEADEGFLTAAIADFVNNAGKISTLPFFEVRTFKREVKTYMDSRGKDFKMHCPDDGFHECLPNPHFKQLNIMVGPYLQDLALAVDELRPLEVSEVAGDQHDKQYRIYVDRPRLRMKLIAAAAGPPGVTLVTGTAGSGKTSSLARLVTLSSPAVRAIYVIPPEEELPEPGSIRVAIHAIGKSPSDVLAQISDAFAKINPIGRTADEILDHLERHIRSEGKISTVVLDAIDESPGAKEMFDQVISPLVRRCGAYLRLIIGIRSRPEGRPDPRTRSVIDDAVRGLDAQVIRVDSNDYFNPDHIRDLVRRTLLETPHSPYAMAADSTLIAKFIESIRIAAGHSFLIAEIAAQSLAHDGAVISADDDLFLDALNRELVGVFRRLLDSSFRANTNPLAVRRALTVLRALAFAHGPGLPWWGIWPKVATAVDQDGASDMAFGDSDIEALLGSAVNAFLHSEEQDGYTVYRIAHDELRRVLREEWRALIAEPSEATLTDNMEIADEIQEVESRIAAELAALVRPGRRVRGIIELAPYVRRHLADHAYAGDVLDRIPDMFLPYLDLARFRQVIGVPPALAARFPILDVLRDITPRWNFETPNSNAAAVSMWSAIRGYELDRFDVFPWRVGWGRLAAPTDGDRVAHIASRARAVATVSVEEDDPSGLRRISVLGVAACNDGNLRFWDLQSAQERGSIRVQSTGEVTAVSALASPISGSMVISGGTDGSVRVWELPSRRRLYELAAGDSKITALAASGSDSRSVLVVAANQAGSLSVWSLPGVEPIAIRRTAAETIEGVDSPRQIVGLAVLQQADNVLVVGIREDGTLLRWQISPNGDEEFRAVEHPERDAPSTGSLQGFCNLAIAAVNDRTVVVAGVYDRVLMWDLETATPLGTYIKTGQWEARSLAVWQSEHGTMAATAGNDVRLWDLARCVQIGEPLRGIGMLSVDALAVDKLPSGETLAFGVDREGTAQTWDISSFLKTGRTSDTSAQSSRYTGMIEAVTVVPGIGVIVVCGGTVVTPWGLQTGDAAPVYDGRAAAPLTAIANTTLANGQPVVATGDFNGRVQIRNLTTGEVKVDPEIRSSRIRSLVALRTHYGSPVVVSGGWHGELRLWEASSGLAIGDAVSAHHHKIATVLVDMTTIDDGYALVSGGRDGLVRRWAVRDGRLPCLVSLDGDIDVGSPVSAMCALPLNGRPGLAIGTEDGTVTFHDYVSGDQVGDAWPAFNVRVVALAPIDTDTEGTIVLAAGAQTPDVKTWNAFTGQPAFVPLPTPGSVSTLCPTPDPAQVVIAGAGLFVASINRARL